MARYEIWNNGIECGKDVANTGSNIKEIWNQGVLWWKKLNLIGEWVLLDYIEDITQEGASHLWNDFVGSSSILLQGTGYNNELAIFRFSGNTFTYDVIARDFSSNALFEVRDTYYFGSWTSLIRNNSIIRLNTDNTYDRLTNYEVHIFVNNNEIDKNDGLIVVGNLYYDTASTGSSNSFNFQPSMKLAVVNIEVLYITAVHASYYDYKTMVLQFRTTDFKNFYANDVLYDSINDIYYQDIQYKFDSNLSGSQIYPVVETDGGYYFKRLSNPQYNTSSNRIVYNTTEFIFTNDFETFSLVSFPTSGLSYNDRIGSLIISRSIYTSGYKGYTRENDLENTVEDALGFSLSSVDCTDFGSGMKAKTVKSYSVLNCYNFDSGSEGTRIVLIEYPSTVLAYRKVSDDGIRKPTSPFDFSSCTVLRKDNYIYALLIGTYDLGFVKDIAVYCININEQEV